jgi:hypothetical protein
VAQVGLQALARAALERQREAQLSGANSAVIASARFACVAQPLRARTVKAPSVRAP